MGKKQKAMDKRKIILIAGRVRGWMLRKAIAEMTGYLGVDQTDLACGCAIASARLLSELIKNGIKGAKIVTSDYHAYVMINEYILDVTATQFPGFKDRKVLFMPWEKFLELPYNLEWWTNGIGKPTTCPKKFRKAQVRGSWPKDQIIRAEHLA